MNLGVTLKLVPSKVRSYNAIHLLSKFGPVHSLQRRTQGARHRADVGGLQGLFSLYPEANHPLQIKFCSSTQC